jgi:hypothetical protein
MPLKITENSPKTTPISTKGEVIPSPGSGWATVFYRVYCALFSTENYDELLPAHYAWKVPEKGFKINWVMGQNHLKN